MSEITIRGGSGGTECRIVTSGLDVCEDGYRWMHFECLEHGTQWRMFVGGTTRRSCTTLASVLSPPEDSEGESFDVEGVDDYGG